MIVDPETGEVLLEEAIGIFKCSNNIAEYRGVILSLKKALDLGVEDLTIHSDSQLVVNQINGDWEPKNETLISLREKVWEIASSLSSAEIVWVPREKNVMADALCTEKLEEIYPLEKWQIYREKLEREQGHGPGHTSPIGRGT